MAELKETHIIKQRVGSRATPWLSFIVGVLLVALVAFFFMYARGTIRNGPGGQTIQFSVKPQIPAPPAPANTR